MSVAVMRSLELDDKCVCPKCQHMVAHKKGEPCSLKSCPNCEGKMTRTLADGSSLVDSERSDDPREAIKIKGTRHYQYYDVKTQVIKPGSGDNTIVMKTAFSKDGHYIGTSIDAYRLVNVHGIHKFEKAAKTDNVCSIGFAPSQRKWYGWSHRAMKGYGVGSKYKTARAANMTQAKRMAVQFAKSVS